MPRLQLTSLMEYEQRVVSPTAANSTICTSQRSSKHPCSSVSQSAETPASEQDELSSGRMRESITRSQVPTNRSVDLSDCINGLAHAFKAIDISFSPLGTP